MAGSFSRRGRAPVKRPEGEIRQSQVVTTFGPGAMVDLVDRAVVIGGLEHWGWGGARPRPLDDARLRRSLLPRLKRLDPSLDLAAENYFRMPPEGDRKEASPLVGVRALEFPSWFVCQRCNRLARSRQGFEAANGRRPGYVHGCSGVPSRVVPVRFVAACQHGHLSDFPWVSFAHSEGSCQRPELYLKEGATGDISSITVECRNCGSRRSMSDAAILPFSCNGDRPWLGGSEVNAECDEPLKLLVRTASHAYFSQVESALRLPEPAPDELTLALRQDDIWRLLHKVETVDQLRMLAGLQDQVASVIAGHSLERVVATLERERHAGEQIQELPLRTAEYLRFLAAEDERPGMLARQGEEFVAFRVPEARADLPPGVGRLILVPELREVRVQVSFSRFASVSANFQGEYDLDRQGVRPATLTLPTGNEKWLPAAEIRGEGLFFELDAEKVAEWERRDAVVERTERLLRGFQASSGGGDFPGARFILLHSMAHLLLTAISLECGYAASAIRERVYCDPAAPRDGGMAGILLFTGTTGSEGTLGGLVEEGRRLRHHLRQAWDFGRLCSNDPVCAAHDPSSPQDDRRLEGAACHGCLYIAECSCEWFNRYLDRALVVPTLGNPPELAYFRDRP